MYVLVQKEMSGNESLSEKREVAEVLEELEEQRLLFAGWELG